MKIIFIFLVDNGLVCLLSRDYASAQECAEMRRTGFILGDDFGEKMGYGLKSTAAAACVALALCTAESFAAARQVENLSRGLSVAAAATGVVVGWRLLATDNPDVQFNLYRDGTKIATIGAKDPTFYADASGSTSSTYAVAPVVNGVEGSKSAAEIVLDGKYKDGNSKVTFPYKTINVDVPASQTMPDGTTCTYTANDMSVGDLDGDGQLDLVLKWDPSNSQDNSKDGYTGSVIIDGLKLDGTRLWRIDLGKNIRAGAHYTQFMVYDLDGDGIAEIVMKTSDGTVDGTGKVIGDGSKDYRTSAGRIMSGNEYLTVFKGNTGAAVTTIDYWPKRDITSNWGDTYGNRSERMLAAVAYLDGAHPSVIMCRGYYTQAYLAAYNFDGKNLTQLWTHKSETSGQGLYGMGNHNLSIGDVDGDGYDEIVYGAGALNHDGTLKYRTGLGHGDAMHLSDMDPDREGLEVWDVHEEKTVAYSDELHDKDGKIIWGTAQIGSDNGRGLAADLDSSYRGFEMWSGASGGIRTISGASVSTTTPSQNFRLYFDGDLQDELLDATGSGGSGGKIEKWNQGTKAIDRMLSFYNVNSSTLNNYTKANPCIVADLFGDWREEFIARSSADAGQLNIFTTPYTTNYRVYSLMHDTHYRVSIAWQNVAYNQPPHLGYYLPDAVKNLTKPNVYVVGGSSNSTESSSSSISGGETQVSSSSAAGSSSSAAQDFDYASVINAAYPDAGEGVYEETNAGWLDGGYYNFTNESGSSGTWTVNSLTAGTTTIAFRYANGSDADRDMTLVVNGVQTGTVSFGSTGTWTTYSVATAEIELNAGANTIQLISATANGGPNLDEIGFASTGVCTQADYDAGKSGCVDQGTQSMEMVRNFRNSFDALTGTLYVSESGMAEVYVYDINGLMVQGMSAAVPAGETVLNLQKGSLAKGLYVVKVKFNGRVIGKKTISHLR